MAQLGKFDPPGNMTDFDDVTPAKGAPSLRDQWSEFMSKVFDEVVQLEKDRFKDGPALTAQYYNPLTEDPGPTLEQEIPWNAFSKELLRRYGRPRALAEADTLWPLSRYSASFNGADATTTFYRPLTEYCEWHVLRDPDTNAIRRVTFTSEPPEYWQALCGDAVPTATDSYQFKVADRTKLLALYRELVSPRVELEDLLAPKDIVIRQPDFVISKGQYNIYNKWNTSLGIVHLGAPPNSLAAEVQLGGDATVLWVNGKNEPVVDADPLICCAQYGGPDRNSDPTIGGTVNALARLGAKITLRNPVGLYMDHIDLTGWSLPGGVSPADCVHAVRGDPARRMIERLVVEVPPDTGLTVSDIRIGGEPIKFGGQIAECITVKLVGLGALAGITSNPALSCAGRCCVDPADLRTLNRSVSYYGDDDKKTPIPAPLGTVDAFVGEGALRAEPVTVPLMGSAVSFAALAPAPRPAPHHTHKRSKRAI